MKGLLGQMEWRWWWWWWGVPHNRVKTNETKAPQFPQSAILLLFSSLMERPVEKAAVWGLESGVAAKRVEVKAQRLKTKGQQGGGQMFAQK